ncbi:MULTISPECIES: hypothetical protein [Caproicibacterium]|jgi:hypothetical protein|uniref:Uncharacterized protein n=1 Tax=Caproicibacterium lactatifermentans TaxID=2666138 RepID=A0A859DNE9_9FIRM|nr:hypothetical protein [Caproicibacterium lactatifermentans]ARP50749.1 hypothetical protein B6259_07620 [Ruminococcaceae bacterium CPB6]MDD4807010.1 hypothetical protein [Oscillospiraceae bacterium]QKN23517.1 hypothetical protein GJQ69_02855 [Caproicibacterium lactatifermentans]QKO29804.1 hypothetical protein GKP14_01510 [Caproicibacterium lactatifermentans]
MTLKRLLYQSYRYVVTGAAFLLLLFPNLSVAAQMHGSLEFYFLACYGGICDVEDILSISNLRWMIPNVVSVYMLSNLF